MFCLASLLITSIIFSASARLLSPERPRRTGESTGTAYTTCPCSRTCCCSAFSAAMRSCLRARRNRDGDPQWLSRAGSSTSSATSSSSSSSEAAGRTGSVSRNVSPVSWSVTSSVKRAALPRNSIPLCRAAVVVVVRCVCVSEHHPLRSDRSLWLCGTVCCPLQIDCDSTVTTNELACRSAGVGRSFVRHR